MQTSVPPPFFVCASICLRGDCYRTPSNTAMRSVSTLFLHAGAIQRCPYLYFNILVLAISSENCPHNQFVIFDKLGDASSSSRLWRCLEVKLERVRQCKETED